MIGRAVDFAKVHPRDERWPTFLGFTSAAEECTAPCSRPRPHRQHQHQCSLWSIRADQLRRLRTTKGTETETGRLELSSIAAFAVGIALGLVSAGRGVTQRKEYRCCRRTDRPQGPSCRTCTWKSGINHERSCGGTLKHILCQSWLSAVTFSA